MSDHERDHQGDDELTQQNAPGAQGDVGAGQGTAGLEDPVVGDPPLVGTEQPRRDEPEPGSEPQPDDEPLPGTEGDDLYGDPSVDWAELGDRSGSRGVGPDLATPLDENPSEGATDVNGGNSTR